MVKLSERFSFQALTDALGSSVRIERTDVTRRYERKQIILNVTSSALLGNSRSHVVSMTSNFLTLVRPAKGWHVQWEVSPTGVRVGAP